MIHVTEAARKKFLEVIEAEGRRNHGLRVIVRNGGTYQPQYALNFVAPNEAAGDDTVVDVDGKFKVFIDPESARWLEGASVDFVETLHESGFKIDAPKAGLPRPTGPVAEAVQKVLEEKINPAVGGHGGHVALVALQDDTAYLRFGGGCQGCGMISVTLKQGVEKAILESVPQVRRVLDVTDHASGQNPYYDSGR